VRRLARARADRAGSPVGPGGRVPAAGRCQPRAGAPDRAGRPGQTRCGRGRWCSRGSSALVRLPGRRRRPVLRGVAAPAARAAGATPAGCPRPATAVVARTHPDHPEDGACQRCGQQVAAGRNRVELRLGTLAGITDRGRLRLRNEGRGGAGPGRAGQRGDRVRGVSSSCRAGSAARPRCTPGPGAGAGAGRGAARPGRHPERGRAAVRAVSGLSDPIRAQPAELYVRVRRGHRRRGDRGLGRRQPRVLAGRREPYASSCLTVDDTPIAGGRRPAVARRAGRPRRPRR